MTPVYLFDLAARHTRWAEARQVAITGNIANANTSGYEAMDVEPFELKVSETTRMTYGNSS